MLIHLPNHDPTSNVPIMAAESETRLATLEQLVHEQAVTIASQASALSEQSRTIDELAAESRTFGGVTRSYERALLELTKFIFPGGLWVEKGTIGRQARSSQAWANGEEGGKEWEWQVSSPRSLPTFEGELLTLAGSRQPAVLQPSLYQPLCYAGAGVAHDDLRAVRDLGDDRVDGDVEVTLPGLVPVSRCGRSFALPRDQDRRKRGTKAVLYKGQSTY